MKNDSHLMMKLKFRYISFVLKIDVLFSKIVYKKLISSSRLPWGKSSSHRNDCDTSCTPWSHSNSQAISEEESIFAHYHPRNFGR